MSPLHNGTFCPISASGSNFNPQNTLCITAVNPPKFGGRLKLSLSLNLNKNQHFPKVSVFKNIDELKV